MLPPPPPSPFGDGDRDVHDFEDDDDDAAEYDDTDHTLALPSPRSKSRPGFKRRSSMEMGSKLRRQILQNSQMLVEEEVRARKWE